MTLIIPLAFRCIFHHANYSSAVLTLGHSGKYKAIQIYNVFPHKDYIVYCFEYNFLPHENYLRFIE